MSVTTPANPLGNHTRRKPLTELSPRRGDWHVYAISAAVIVLAAATVVIATILSTPTAPVSTLTAAETMFLGLMHADENADNSSLLYLGHGVCEDIASTGGDYSGVRLAVGKLMSAQEPPAYAQQMVAAARASGLCDR
jgi:hypothetical protein